MEFEIPLDPLVVSDNQHASICNRAYSAHANSQPIKNFQVGEFLGEEDLKKIFSGIASIALGNYGEDYHGLSKDMADSVIGSLSGDIDDFAFHAT